MLDPILTITNMFVLFVRDNIFKIDGVNTEAFKLVHVVRDEAIVHLILQVWDLAS